MTPSAKLKQLWDARIAEIVRERDEALLRINQLETECGHLQADLHEAGDGDTWEAAHDRIERELVYTRQQLLERARERDALAATCVEAADQIDTLRSEVERLNTAWRAIDRANESLRERIDEAKALLLSDTITEPCGHAHKWLAHRDPIDPASPTYCTFCEMARLRGLLREAVAYSKELEDGFGGEPVVIYDGSNIPRRWFEKAQAALEGKP